MRGIALFLLGGALAACASAPQPRSPRAENHLREVLDGKVAQAPVDCLTSFGSDDMIVIDDETILFRQGSRIYRNDLHGGCSGLSMGNTLVTKRFGAQLCRGDIAKVINTSGGVTVGSCVIGDFVPYLPAGG